MQELGDLLKTVSVKAMDTERLSERERERKSFLNKDVGNGSESGQMNDLAAAVQTDLNHNSWCRRRRTSVSCCILTAVQQEPRDGALGCT